MKNTAYFFVIHTFSKSFKTNAKMFLGKSVKAYFKVGTKDGEIVKVRFES